MSYCINPNCQQRQNLNQEERCQACGNSLLINERYWLVRPLRELRQEHNAEVFEVDDRGTLKVMKILKQNGSKWIEMLQREAMVLSQLRHPGIPRIEPDGYFTLTLLLANGSKTLHCLVMEKIEGQNLERWLQENEPISQKQALEWLQQLVEILDLVHDNRFFHRDIKPSNIMLKSDGQLVLIDFGAVKYATTTYLISLGQGLQGTRVFSYGYAPLEQIQGKATNQSDFFALGRTFVHLLTGQLPSSFSEETGKLIWRNFATQVSKPLADFIDDLMAPSPNKRPKNTRVILQRLEQIIIETDELRQFLESSIRSSLEDLPSPIRFLAQQIFQHQLQQWVKQHRVPKIALYGRSGSGKSSLINAILGKRVAEVGVSIPTTKSLEPYEYQRDGWKLKFIDSRGVGDSRDDTAFELALDDIVQQKVDILLFVIPANERGYVSHDVKFLTALQQKHQRAHRAKLPIILVINKIDQIDPPFEWNPMPPYDLSLNSDRRRSPTTAREAKEGNIVECVQARLNEYKDLITSYVPVCAFWDKFGNRLYNIDALAIQTYNYIPDEAAKRGFGGATAGTLFKKAVAESFTLAAAWFAYFSFFLPVAAIYKKVVFITQFRLVNIIAQIATTNEDQSNATDDFLNQLGVQEPHAKGNPKADLAMTLAIGKAAIHFFIEKGTIVEATKALTEEKELREPEFQEALQGGPREVVSKLLEIDKELHERYGLRRIYEDE